MLATLLAGCGTAADSNSGEAASGDSPATVEPPTETAVGPSAGPQPDERAPGVDTIMIEGMAEELPTRLVEAPAGFPLHFTTIVPADMTTAFASSGEGESLRLEAEFGGVPSPEASLSFVVLPAGTDAAAAERVAGDVAVEAGGAPSDVERFAWSSAEYRLAGDRFGFVALGERAGRWFYFFASYPPEFGDGMGPRIDLVLRRWRWDDDRPLALGEVASYQ